MLQPYRVLDASGRNGWMAGFLLAQLGAEVICVEPPEGQRSRHLGPFVDDEAGPERSLFHWAYNRGKRSVVLGNDDGALAGLAAGSDVVLECGAMPVDLAALRAANPALITVSITRWASNAY